MIISYHMLNANSLPIRKGGQTVDGSRHSLAESVYFYTMYTILVFLVIGLFVAILFLQFYFRMKVLKVYRVLVQHRVQFQPGDLFHKDRLATVKERYPQRAEDIQLFADHLMYSVRMASILIVLITVFGGILMYFRD